ncbi:MAG: hypothetical protein WCK76_05885, partial [Elusimicrobiota bacterium]
RENVLKTEGIDASIAAAARRQADALEEFSRRLRSEIGAMNQDFSAAAKAENDKRFEKFGAKYAEALLSAAFVESFRAAVAESVDKFEKSGAQLEAFLKEASPDQLQKATGVSGMMIRRQFETMTAMLEALRTDTTRLREIKKSVEDRFGDIFKEG